MIQKKLIWSNDDNKPTRSEIQKPDALDEIDNRLYS